MKGTKPSETSKDTTSGFKKYLSPISVSLLITFYVFAIGSYFKPTIYPLINRVVYETQFIDRFIVNEYVDQLILCTILIIWISSTLKTNKKFLISITIIILVIIFLITSINEILMFLSLMTMPIVIVTLVINKYFNDFVFDAKLVIKCLSLTICILGVLSVIITVFEAVYPSVELPPLNFLYYIHLLISLFSPILVILISFTLLLRFLFEKRSKNEGLFGSLLRYKNLDSVIALTTMKRVLIVTMIIIVSLTTPLIPIGMSNNSEEFISADSVEYEKTINSLDETSSPTLFFIQIFVEQMNGDRPLSLLIFFSLSKIFNLFGMVPAVEYFPIFLTPLLTITTFVLVRFSTQNDYNAVLSALLTLASFNFLIGIYGGLFANWLALSFVVLFLYFTLKFIRQKSVFDLSLSSLMLTIVLLCHVPTWSFMMIIILCFYAILFIVKMESKKILFCLIIALLPAVGLEIVRSHYVQYSGFEENLIFSQERANFSGDIVRFWYNLLDTYYVYLAGIYSNSIIFSIVLFWAFFSKSRSPIFLLFLVFFLMTLGSMLIGEQDIQSRILYEIPIQIPAAFGLMYIKKIFGNFIFAGLCTWLFAISIRTITNFEFQNLPS